MPETDARAAAARPTARRSVIVDGVPVEADVDPDLLRDVLLLALERVAARPRRHRRAFALLVAPPGAGKSTLAAVIGEEAAARGLALDVLGLDGYHHSNDYLADHPADPDDTSPDAAPLSSIKGAPATFDVVALVRDLAAARNDSDGAASWPVYDRRTHEVSPERRPLTADLALLEGTWLLLDEPGWRDVASAADLVVFVDADPSDLAERLVARKVRGGLSRSEAEAFHARSDHPNVIRVLADSDRTRVDVLLRLHADGSLTHQGGHQ
ncbi:nucleoside/nucleotide kinase family protein [Nocardioides sp. HDW12B]|uniref:nucleoside/nucleotide kinase family protein n=1 Tax=Nocardioides sp. HDW12B TaxID=2714939 RepID=UPI00140C1756|nr:nucleoside/nucleotide kinase family protein [Nocardioides sp. HDW12B]QIK67353.1 nucleoside/nucleotide kinase family protein [Nocardioides sp. HDW12B]